MTLQQCNEVTVPFDMTLFDRWGPPVVDRSEYGRSELGPASNLLSWDTTLGLTPKNVLAHDVSVRHV